MLVISPIWLLARMLGMKWLGFRELDRELPSALHHMSRICASGRTLEKQVIPARQTDFRHRALHRIGAGAVQGPVALKVHHLPART